MPSNDPAFSMSLNDWWLALSRRKHHPNFMFLHLFSVLLFLVFCTHHLITNFSFISLIFPTFNISFFRTLFLKSLCEKWFAICTVPCLLLLLFFFIISISWCLLFLSFSISTCSISS